MSVCLSDACVWPRRNAYHRCMLLFSHQTVPNETYTYAVHCVIRVQFARARVYKFIEIHISIYLIIINTGGTVIRAMLMLCANANACAVCVFKSSETTTKRFAICLKEYIIGPAWTESIARLHDFQSCAREHFLSLCDFLSCVRRVWCMWCVCHVSWAQVLEEPHAIGLAARLHRTHSPTYR